MKVTNFLPHFFFSHTREPDQHLKTGFISHLSSRYPPHTRYTYRTRLDKDASTHLYLNFMSAISHKLEIITTNQRLKHVNICKLVLGSWFYTQNSFLHIFWFK